MNIILFDDDSREYLLPLTFTRPVADIRIGILTIREKWEKYLHVSSSSLTEDYLSAQFPTKVESTNLLINASVCPDESLLREIQQLKRGQALVSAEGNVLMAMVVDRSELTSIGETPADQPIDRSDAEEVLYAAPFMRISRPWHIFQYCAEAIQSDFDLITRGRKSASLSSSNTIVGEGQIFVEEGVVAEATVINLNHGPIYLGKDSEVMEGCLVRGPFALGEHAVLKMGAKIYGATSIGPHCKIGGEVNNSVFFGYSNKAHDGFIGNSVIGEWCNIGADTNNSNLKNTYEEVKLWCYPENRFISTGLQFCGLIMGDHSKCGINTMFNTGTVVGISANVFGGGFPRNFIPSFSWGGAAGLSVYDFAKSTKVAEQVMARREHVLTQTEKDILEYVFQLTQRQRKGLH